jgi:predicted RNA polymerase sigma factor
VLAAIFREEGSRLTASVMRVLGDFDAAEEVVQDALVAAWQQWPVDGVPQRPAAWLWTVARRRAVDVLRRDVRHREKLAQLAWPAEHPSEPDADDDRLRLVFTCCHPFVACHAEADSWQSTDWLQILLLYDALLRRQPSPVIRLHRAIALGQVLGAQVALDEVDALADELDRYHLFHATRAELLRALCRSVEARRADERALGLTANPAERALLEQRLT